MVVDINDIIYLASRVISEAMPIGFVFGISEWILYTFFGFVFGKRTYRGDY